MLLCHSRKWKGSKADTPPTEDDNPEATAIDADDLPATSENMERFFEHLDAVMVETGFLNPDNPRHLRRKVRRYFESNRPSGNELSMFRGILSATQNPRKS